jgi:predicted transcriptional regulator of viral defense system
MNKHAPIKKIALSIGNLKQPVVTNYQLGIIFFTQKKESITFDELVKGLLSVGIIEINKDFPGDSVYNVFGRSDPSAMEVACSIDPFAYVSHLSAMEYHGLTDRISRMLFLSSPSQQKWRIFAKDRMARYLGKNISRYEKSRLPRLTRIPIRKIGKKNVSFYSSSHLGAYKSVKDKTLRISTLGRTFMDMLRRPDLCGGIYHVIDVYREYAKQYLDLIVDEIDSHGKKIDRVRAGYMLEEICKLEHRKVKRWLKDVQRGGSRKLDSTNDYSARYSERWSLSINVEIDGQ